MTIRSIRSRARHIQKTTPGIYALFLIPILSRIISIVYQTLHNQMDSVSSSGLSTTDFIQQFSSIGLLASALSGLIFTLVITILLSLFSISALFSTLEVLRQQRDEVGLIDSFQAFDTVVFGKIFRTLLLKQFFLFLWNLINFIGTFMMLGSLGALFLSILNNSPNPLIGNLFVVSLIISIIGLAIAIPQSYAYSQVEYLLYERLHDNQYTSAFRIIRDSRKLMKGYKARRFVLDLSFIGWWFLTGITLGIVGFYTIPYQSIANTIFYEELLKEKQE